MLPQSQSQSQSLAWKRSKKDIMGGICILVVTGDGVSNVLVLDKGSTRCASGEVGNKIDERIDQFKKAVSRNKAVDFNKRVILNMDGRAWRGLSAYVREVKTNFFIGCTYRGLEVFNFHILRKSRTPIPDDLRTFLADIKITNSFPESPSTPYIRDGNVLISQKRYRRAMSTFNKGVKADSEHWPVWYYRGMCQRRMKDYDGAVNSLKKALDLGGESAVYVELGKAYTSAGRSIQALMAFNRAMRLNPESDRAYLYRGNLFMKDKKYDRALKDYNKSLELNPCSRAAGFNSAQIFYHIEKKPAQAAERLQKVVEYHPSYKKAQEYLARLPKNLPEKVAKNDASPEERNTSSAGRKKLPDWIRRLPEIPEVKPVSLTPGLDYSALTEAQYAGAVRAAKEACRQLLGPLSAAEEKAFQEKWQPMLDFPAPQCREYLEKLVPVLEKILGLRAALADHLLAYDRLWKEAGFAVYYDKKTGARLMETVAREAAIIESLKTSLKILMDELTALGDPPDASELKARAASRHNRAMRALERLLGKSAPLKGVYDRLSLVTYEYEDGDREKPYFNQYPLQKKAQRRVFMPLSKNSKGLVLFYEYVMNAPAKPGRFLSGIIDSDFFRCIYAEPDGPYWVSYEYDSDDGETTATYYRPESNSLAIDEYVIQDGELQEAMRTSFHRRSPDKPVQRYPKGMNEKKLKTLLRRQKDGVREMAQSFEKGKKVFQRYVGTNGFLPDMPGHMELYWVLKDVKVTDQYKRQFYVKDTESKKIKIENINNHIGDHSLTAKWEKTTTDYELKFIKGSKTPDNYIPSPDEEGSPGQMKRVPVRKEKKEASVDLVWSPAPLAVPDGGYWPLHVRGSGPWTFSLNQPFDKTGQPSSGLNGSMMAQYDKLFVYDQPPASDAKISSFGKPKDSHLMVMDAEKQGGDHWRYFAFRSDAAESAQKEYVISFTVLCEGGWMKVECLYELKKLDRREAEKLLRKTAQRNEEAARMIASIKAQMPSTEPPAREASVQDEEAREAQKERIEFHKANIEFCRQEVQRLESELQKVKSRLSAGKASKSDIERYNQLKFRVTCQQSNIISERDRIKELKTGKAHFSRTPFDEMCRMQTVHKVEQEVRRLDDASRAHRKAELLANKLSGAQRQKARELIDKTIAEGGALDPSKWSQLNGALQNIYQGEQQQEIAKIEEELAWKQAQLEAAQHVKESADAGMMLLSLTGGPMYVTALYQTGTGFAEGGILEGVKRGTMVMSDAADVAISGYQGWKKGGWWGMVEGASWSILLNKGPEAALRRINMRGMSVGKNAELDSNAAKNIEVSPTRQPVDLSPTRAAQFKQELEYGESMAEDFFRAHRKLRTAQIKRNVSPEALDNLRMQVRQKAAAVAHSMPAKSYLKYKADPIKGKAYSETMDEILDDATSAFNWEMKNRGYNRQELYHCRNASSKGAGMDADLALKEQPDMIPVRGDDGQVTWKKNNWLTKNGRPASVHQYQKEGSEALQEAYKKVTGGYSAHQSFVDMTTSVGAESYPDLTWLKLPKRTKHADAARVTRKLDDFFGKVDPAKVHDSLKITPKKADIMFKKHPELRPLGSMMESCRGGAKDLETKFIPLVDNKIRNIKSIAPGKRTALQVNRLKELNQTKHHLEKCMNCFKDIGQGRIPPYEWESQFRIVTGGRNPVAVMRRLQKITEKASER